MKNQTPIKLAVLILFQCIITTMLFAQAPATSTHQDSSGTKFPKVSTYTNTRLTYKIIDAPNNTYCYDVFADGKLMIHQSSAPALPGNEGFKQKPMLRK